MIGPIEFVVCEWCGNKRCPHAWNKDFKCTDSNALDQVGEPLGSRELPPQWSVLDRTDMGVLLGPYPNRTLAEIAMRDYGYSHFGYVVRSR